MLFYECRPKTFAFMKSIDGLVNPDSMEMRYAELIECINFDMNAFALQVLKIAIQSIDTAFRDSPQRKAAYHVRGNPVRTLHTVFGDLTFSRTLYNDKHDRKHLFCFVDHVLALPKYIQYDPCIRSLVFSYSLKFNSMEKVGLVVGDLMQGFSFGLQKRKQKALSKQLVASILHATPSFYIPASRCETTPDQLYVMSDEKYKSLQMEHASNGKAKKTMIKMAIIFEGIEQQGKRRKLINPFTVTGYGESFWQDVLDRLHERYDMDKVKTIVTMGDGASWIYASKDELKTATTKTRFLLDAFHAKQAINRISRIEENQELLTYYLINDEKKEFKYLVDMIKKGKQKDRIERITKQYNYLRSRWKEAVAIFKAEIGCPMESHIEHNLASLISSVPKAYSRSYLKKLVEMIAYEKNGYDMQTYYLRSINMKAENDIVKFDDHLDFSLFDLKPDSYDKGDSSRTISKLLKMIANS